MRRLLVGVVLALAVAGCGGDPKADPTPTPSSPSSSSTTPAPPVMPDAAKADTKAGAVAFVKYYVELVNHAQATGDVAGLREAEAPQCESCQNVRDSIATIYRNGGSVSGGAWHPHFSSALRNADTSWLVNGYITFDPGHVHRTSDAPIETEPGGSAATHVTVLFANDRWKVTKWSRDS